MIGAVGGLLTLLSALVLGLLIWTAYGVYSSQNTAIQTLAAKVLQLDLALADYGPEGAAGRAQVRQDLAKTIDRVWNANQSDNTFAANNFAAAIENLRQRRDISSLLFLRRMNRSRHWPRPPKRLNRSANRGCRCRLRCTTQFRICSLLSLSVGGPRFFADSASCRALILWPSSRWLSALAVASVLYLVLDLSSPYSGLFRASSAPLDQVLAYMGRGQGAVEGQC